MIDYSAPGAFSIVPFYQILDGTAFEQNPGLIDGKIVLIGAFFKESHDLYFAPVEKRSGLYGVEIHANIINTLASSREFLLRPVSSGINRMILIGFALIAATLFIRFKPQTGIFIALGLMLLYSGAAMFLYGTTGWMINLVEPMLALLFAWFGAMVLNYLTVEKERKRVRQTFSRFVSSDVVDSLLDSGSDVELGGELREVAIFFSDICGFTSMSEKMNPAEIVEMLNSYFTEMTDIVFAHGGTLNKYIGDAIMAIYGAPLPMENPSEMALKASLEMRRVLEEFNKTRVAEGKPPVHIGMGLHRGKVLVGNIGSPRQMEYTVIGDAVNVCSRIEGLTRDFDTDLLISDDLYNDVAGLVEVETHDPVAVKGKSGKVVVHSVTGLKAPSKENDHR